MPLVLRAYDHEGAWLIISYELRSILSVFKDNRQLLNAQNSHSVNIYSSCWKEISKVINGCIEHPRSV